MNYDEALKKVQAIKPKENYMVVQLGYDNNILLPHKDGIQLVAALNNAEKLDEPYNKPHRIKELQKDSITVRFMSNAEYIRFKIAGLLNLTIDEVTAAEEIANNPITT